MKRSLALELLASIGRFSVCPRGISVGTTFWVWCFVSGDARWIRGGDSIAMDSGLQSFTGDLASTQGFGISSLTNWNFDVPRGFTSHFFEKAKKCCLFFVRRTASCDALWFLGPFTLPDSELSTRRDWLKRKQAGGTRRGSSIFNSKYQVVGKPGYGGYSTAWLCRDLVWVVFHCLSMSLSLSQRAATCYAKDWYTEALLDDPWLKSWLSRNKILQSPSIGTGHSEVIAPWGSLLKIT